MTDTKHLLVSVEKAYKVGLSEKLTEKLKFILRSGRLLHRQLSG